MILLPPFTIKLSFGFGGDLGSSGLNETFISKVTMSYYSDKKQRAIEIT